MRSCRWRWTCGSPSWSMATLGCTPWSTRRYCRRSEARSRSFHHRSQRQSRNHRNQTEQHTRSYVESRSRRFAILHHTHGLEAECGERRVAAAEPGTDDGAQLDVSWKSVEIAKGESQNEAAGDIDREGTPRKPAIAARLQPGPNPVAQERACGTRQSNPEEQSHGLLVTSCNSAS